MGLAIFIRNLLDFKFYAFPVSQKIEPRAWHGLGKHPTHESHGPSKGHDFPLHIPVVHGLF